jgi:hypothetical protein
MPDEKGGDWQNARGWGLPAENTRQKKGGLAKHQGKGWRQAEKRGRQVKGCQAEKRRVPGRRHQAEKGDFGKGQGKNAVGAILVPPQRLAAFQSQDIAVNTNNTNRSLSSILPQEFHPQFANCFLLQVISFSSS